MPPLLKKQRLANSKAASNEASASSNAAVGPPLSAATEDEKRQWQGFCELDSEPVSWAS